MLFEIVVKTHHQKIAFYEYHVHFSRVPRVHDWLLRMPDLRIGDGVLREIKVSHLTEEYGDMVLKPLSDQ